MKSLKAAGCKSSLFLQPFIPLTIPCPIFYFLLGFCSGTVAENQHVPADGGLWFCGSDFSLDSCTAAASVGDGKVNHFAAQIVFVKEGLHGEGHFVPPDRADNDDFVILRHVLNPKAMKRQRNHE